MTSRVPRHGAGPQRVAFRPNPADTDAMPAGLGRSPGARRTAGGRVLSWLRRRDPELAAVRRAGRVTVAGCIGFYAGRYLLDDPTLALYAVFAAISLGVLSDVSGTPARRTRLLLAALPVGLVVVTLGTLLAANVWAAAAGMLVVGFLVAYSAVSGPGPAGLANGLQLFYILPCFPPYDPDSLPSRLAGLALGVLLLAVADRVLWPAPAPRDFADRLAEAARPVNRYLDAVVVAARGGDVGGLAGPRAAADDAIRSLRLDRVPRAERPVGPGVRDRSLTIAAAALQSFAARLTGFATLIEGSGPPPAAVTDLVAATGRALLPVAPALRGTRPAPELEPLDADIDAFLDRRTRVVATADITLVPRDLRPGTAALMGAQTARTLVVAVRGAVGASVPEAVRRGTVAPATFAYLEQTRAQRWRQRLRRRLSPRSVYLQNAVRLAVGLAVARVVADLPEISHGFWAMLATLTLMRTSVVASRAALVPAFVGVSVGAVLAGVLLVLVGDDVTAYAAALPLLMAAGLAIGPLFGPAAGQVGLTVVIMVLFALVEPVSWFLAETRLLDVVVGGLVGAVIGAAVWPRGGAGEVHRTAAAVLRSGAEGVVATVKRFTAGAAANGSEAARARTARLVALFDATHAQYRAEGAPQRADPDIDWLTVLGVTHRLVDEADLLRGRYPSPEPIRWPLVAPVLDGTAAEVARELDATAAVLAARGSPPPPDSGPRLQALLSSHPPRAPYAQAPIEALCVLDVWGWLHGLADDMSRLHRVLEPRPLAETPDGRGRHRRVSRDEARR